MNICVFVFNGNTFPVLLGELGVELGIPRSRIAGSYDNFMFNFLRNCQSVFQRRYTILHFHQQCMRALISPHPSQDLLWFFLITAFLVGMTWYVTVALICLSLKVNDAEHLFMCFLAICISYLEYCLFKSSAHLVTGFFFFFLVIMMIFFQLKYN